MLTLQNFIMPEPGICTENRLYYREKNPVSLNLDTGQYHIPAGHRISFDTYFNLFNLDSWLGACELDGLYLEITGAGHTEVQITQTLPGRSVPEVRIRRFVSLEAGTPLVLNLNEILTYKPEGVLHLTLTALDTALTLDHARFATCSMPQSWPELALSITTFKREAEVEATVARIEGFLKTYAHADHIRVQVVDNGQSTNIPNSDKVTVFPNRNLGGAGGFSRGLLEAQTRGASHCLFMDDDASFHMENIARAYVFLALARNARTAVAGAMINTTHKWAIWENGAWFDGACRPLFNGTDLRRTRKLMQMQHKENRPKPATFYGGWWFFAFPLGDLAHHPFPFFVRGDDVSFSIANDFDIRTLNGVVSFQDDFTEKESAQTLYLDLRNHIIHHLVFDTLARTPLGTARVAIRFIVRSLLRLHYSSAQAQLLAWKDVMSGPAFFNDNIDMSARRADIKNLASDEIWHPVETQDIPPRLSRLQRLFNCLPRPMHTAFWLLTLNGHILPFWSRIGGRLRLDISKRGLVYYALGGAQITYVSTDQDMAYTCKHSKRRFWQITCEMVRITWRFYKQFEKIKADWRRGYNEMTTQEYWVQTLRDTPPK